jgi:hypothetical protein
MGKIGSPVEFVLDPPRKGGTKTCFLFATQMLVVFDHFSFATPHLQLEIYPPWQIIAFHISDSNGNGII